ncbi:MAG: hypothetical protein KDD06_04770 [Phaeodactylibacter sp.]|nr:hypothetical protein [Phaeodactylibacter sp.]MCB9263497.1 hypothetical protein [Lewinellaceae bacterium]MCB9287625.1 hypothetical protein [Lewinellaceae bacterium]
MNPIRLLSFTGLALFLFVFQSQPLSAQGAFLEAGGAAPYYSLNYTHRIFAAEKWSGYIRAGTGIWGGRLATPIGGTLLLGGGSHHPEITLAFTPYSEGLRFWDRDASDLFLDMALGLGYRYQPVSGSAFVAAGLFPFLRLDPTTETLSEEKAELRVRGGVSVGWFFGG